MPRLTPPSAQARRLLQLQVDRRQPAPFVLSPQNRQLATSSKKKPKTPGPAKKQATPAQPPKSDAKSPLAQAADSPLAAARATSSRLSTQFAEYQGQMRGGSAPPPTAAPSTTDPTATPEEDLQPQPLTRPLGVPSRPAAGENSGVDTRGLQQRRDDLFDWDKHLARRKELTSQIAKPYFRDWSNMRYQKGKVFVAPERVFRADRAQYFPNLRGITLDSPRDECDTTSALAGRLTLVSVYTGEWAQRQTRTFWDDNQALTKILSKGEGVVQCAEINVEEKRLRYALVRAFLYRQRQRLKPEEHSRYFVVHRGFAERLKEQLGMFNGHVGYLFLLDAECRIRWAASAEAIAGEKQSLNKAIVRLAKEYQELAQQRDEAEENMFFNIVGHLLHPKAIAEVVGDMTKTLSEAGEAVLGGVSEGL